MRKIKYILRLGDEAGLAYRRIPCARNTGYGMVVDHLNRAKRAGIEWLVTEGMSEHDLGRLLFPTRAVSFYRTGLPDGLPGTTYIKA